MSLDPREPEGIQQLEGDFTALWKDEAVQKALEHKGRFPIPEAADLCVKLPARIFG